MKPNRQQWASVMADAAINYDQVANEAMVIFDTRTGQFDWGSSLAPMEEPEQIEIQSDVRWEYYTDGNDIPSIQELTNYFAEDYADEAWEATKALISA